MTSKSFYSWKKISSQFHLHDDIQMMIIWRALVTYLDTKLRAGQGVYVKNFGAFNFDIKTDLPKIAATRGRSIGRTLDEDRADRKKVHHMR